MFVGIPWFAWIAIVAIVVGSYSSYKTEQLKMRSKMAEKSNELDEIRKILFQIKSRVENLEAIAAQSPDEFASNQDMGEIEIDDGYNTQSENQKEVSKIANDLRTK